MEVQELGLRWLLGVLVNFGVPALVWATVTTGLILIVRDRIGDAPQSCSTPLVKDITIKCCSGENPLSCGTRCRALCTRAAVAHKADGLASAQAGQS